VDECYGDKDSPGSLATPDASSRAGTFTVINTLPKAVATSSDHTAAWLAFVGALLVAIIAAATAQWRLRHQLTHDRELKDLEELRALLDDCARMAGETSQLMMFMLRRSISLPRKEAPPDEASKGRPALLRELGVKIVVSPRDYSAEDPDFQALEDAFYEAAKPVFGLYQRIILRLGREDELSAAYLELQLQWVALGLSALLAETEPDSPQREAGIRLALSELQAAHFGFLEAARRKIGSRLPVSK